MDEIIQPTVVLLILSLITEKIANFIKLQNDAMAFRTAVCEDEKVRDKKIQQLSIIVGVLVALTAKVNLFEFFKEDFKLFWSADDFEPFKLLSNIIGSVISGLFLSLGSKFFHDLLDILIQIKDLKRKLNDKATYEMNTLKELDEWMGTPESEIINKLIQENINPLEDIISVRFVQDNNPKFIEVLTSSENKSKIPSFLSYTLPNNAIRNYQVKVIASSPIVAHGNLTFKSDITNQERLSNFGSFGLGVKFKNLNGSNKMLLTCYHVIIGQNDDYFSFKYTKNDQVVSPYNDEEATIGTVRNAIRNNEIDAAIIDVNNNTSISNKLPDGSIVKSIMKKEDLRNGIPVKMFGFKNNSTGKITSLNNYASIVYKLPDGSKKNWGIYGLIAVSNYGKALSQEGDSGAALFDNNNKVIGIVVGGSDTTTYAIPIETIFNQLNLELL